MTTTAIAAAAAVGQPKSVTHAAQCFSSGMHIRPAAEKSKTAASMKQRTHHAGLGHVGHVTYGGGVLVVE